jgi:AcrR family transcriptional regulator
MMNRDHSLKDRVIEAGLNLFAVSGFHQTDLNQIAQKAECQPEDLQALLSDKADILLLLEQKIDAEILDAVQPRDPEESVRDRLFDLLMQRFDGLAAYRAGIKSAAQAALSSPCLFLSKAPRGIRQFGAYLDVAGTSSKGLAGMLRMKGLAAVYLFGLRAFLEDESDDLAKTMAALDKALARAEMAAGWFPSS